MGKTGGHNDTHHNANRHCQRKAKQIESHRLCMGIANQQVRNDGCNTGREQHCVHIGKGFILFNQIAHHDTQHGKPHIQQMNAPTAETQSQQKCHRGHIVDAGFGEVEQCRHCQRHQTHIQERSGITTNGKIVGGDLTRLAQNLPEAGQHPATVRHANSRNQEKHRQKNEYQFQKTAFGEIFDLFHR